MKTLLFAILFLTIFRSSQLSYPIPLHISTIFCLISLVSSCIFGGIHSFFTLVIWFVPLFIINHLFRNFIGNSRGFL